MAKLADGQGRMFDPATKVWFDGRNSCWNGGYPWTFKNGAWFFGSYRWYQAGDGMWKTDAPETPIAIDCATVPAFAAKAKPAMAKIDRKETVEHTDETAPTTAENKTTIKTADQSIVEKPARVDAKPANCKKYFPSVGALLSVPCE
jgi:hypothetical protein